MRSPGSWRVGLALALTAAGAQAASIKTESFTGGRMGWTNTGTWVTAGTNNALRGQFGPQGIPIPENGGWVATNTSSGAAFVGDYTAAGIQLIGFSFKAENVLPSSALIRWYGPTSSYFRSFTSHVLATGVWYRLAFALTDKETSGWVGGGSEGFALGLTNVQWIEIQVSRSATNVQRYLVDDVFVDGLPEGVSLALGQVVWSTLRTNVGYTVEAAEDPKGTWAEAGSFSATNRTQSWVDPEATNEGRRVYRLYFNESF